MKFNLYSITIGFDKDTVHVVHQGIRQSLAVQAGIGVQDARELVVGHLLSDPGTLAFCDAHLDKGYAWQEVWSHIATFNVETMDV